MKLFHYIKVACHFWPWERAFWIGLLHDAIEDGWLSYSFVNSMILRGILVNIFRPVISLTRGVGEKYGDYIELVQYIGGDVQRVKIADLLENYKRAQPRSLRTRYAKALLVLAKEG